MAIGLGTRDGNEKMSWFNTSGIDVDTSDFNFVAAKDVQHFDILQ